MVPLGTLSGRTPGILGDLDPFLRWTLAVIAGGGVAGSVEALTTGTRGVSTLTTMGLGNPAIATLDLAGATLLTFGAILLPVAAVAALLGLLWVPGRRLSRVAPA